MFFNAYDSLDVYLLSVSFTSCLQISMNVSEILTIVTPMPCVAIQSAASSVCVKLDSLGREPMELVMVCP